MVVNSVTVVVPHYNRPERVREALLSIHAQTVKPSEIILVDDNSSPENRAKLEELSSLATIISTPRNLGPVVARNLGAQKAKGEWLAFLDDDDCFLPDKQERQIRYLEAHPQVKALGGGLTMVSAEGREEYWGGKPTRQMTLAYALRFTATMSQALMIRRDLFFGTRRIRLSSGSPGGHGVRYSPRCLGTRSPFFGRATVHLPSRWRQTAAYLTMAQNVQGRDEDTQHALRACTEGVRPARCDSAEGTVLQEAWTMERAVGGPVDLGLGMRCRGSPWPHPGRSALWPVEP